MWQVTELESPLFYLIARHLHQHSHVDKHWPFFTCFTPSAYHTFLHIVYC